MSQSSASQASRRLWVAGTAFTALTAVSAISAAVFGLSSAEADAPPAAAPATPVSVAAVQASEVATWEEFSGRLEAVERVELRPRVPGTVQSVHFREGALVKQGDLLISIDPAPYQAEVDRAEAQVAAAKARALYTSSDVARAQRLWAEQAIAQREFDERSNAQREADANLRAAQAGLQAARLNLGYTQVRAPVSGRAGRLEITIGNQVAAGPAAPLLTTLVSVSPIYASFDADEQVVARVASHLSERNRLDRIPVQMGTVGSEGTPLEGKLQLIDNQ
ncbi:MAG: efflux RND transporter periplasmic adaptor subunit, partial [Burkholderiaceae bacterium]